MSECVNKIISATVIQENGSGDADIPVSKESMLNRELKNRLRKYIKKLDGNALKYLLYIYLPSGVKVDILGILSPFAIPSQTCFMGPTV